VVVNNRTYRGQLESLAVFNALCAGFLNAPSMCNQILGSNTPDFTDREQGITAGAIVAVVIGLILLNITIVYCYRRHSKREQQQEMNIQIESAVS
jgi:Na+/melibiose symporter-like transporter